MESLYHYFPLVTILGCLIVQGNCIKCYICSYSPDDRNNRTDKCSEDKFQHQNVYNDECEYACESVIRYDANDELEQWWRNCLHHGQKLTNDCQTEQSAGWRLVRCTCDKDLCNDSVVLQSSAV
ncbi:hypothetical protein X975_17942, partial [Stegodyphus mimosarum]